MNFLQLSPNTWVCGAYTIIVEADGWRAYHHSRALGDVQRTRTAAETLCLNAARAASW